MANRYWVGGTGNWSDDDNHWATSSGGSPANGNLPTSSDDVFIDSNSGFGSGGTITLDDSGSCNNFISNSSDTYSLTGEASLDIYGSFTGESGLTFQGALGFLSEFSETITSNAMSFNPSEFNILGTGTWTLQDDLNIDGCYFYQDNGTFDANDHNVTSSDFYFYADTGYTPTVIMGSGTWEATGGGWSMDELNGEVLTVTPETSTIKLPDGESSVGNGKTYYNLWITGSGVMITGSNTFNDLKIDAGCSVVFEVETTQTVSTFTANGSLGNLITINSSDVGQFALSKSSGAVECDYLDISNSNAIGGATWYAGSHSVDTTNNDGWIFEDKPTPLSPKVIVKNKLNLLSIGSL